jgi:UDP-GlcNAc:undecaprenyl-phosphate/decaprenyl-phosphate GlcNAc-1-phosphate transferase
MTTVSYFALMFAATLWLSRFLLRYMEPDLFLDEPSERKIHTVARPRFGGIAFGLAIIILGWAILNDHAQYTWYFLGALGMFVLGAVDDYWSISWRYKLPSQILIGCIIVAQFIGRVESVSFFEIDITSNIFVMSALFLFWFVGIVNSVNLIDGMDGLAGGYIFLTSFFALVVGWVTNNMDFIYFNTLYMGSMAAFLHFNQKPAKFFMGDSGSLLLGFHVAALPLLFVATQRSPDLLTLNMTPFLLLTTYLIIDTARVFFNRILIRKHPLEPDQNHLHHLLLKTTESYKGTLLTIFLYLSIFGTGAIVSVKSNPGAGVMIGYLVIVGGLVFISKLTDFGINMVTRFVSKFSWDENNLPGYQALVRVRFLPLLTTIYYLSILYLASGELQGVGPTPLLLGSLFLILLFTVKSSVLHHNGEILLIGVGIVQALILIVGSEYNLGQQISINGDMKTVVTLMRFILLGLVSVITVVNYMMRSIRFGQDFWRISDLLVLFILIGLASIQSIGVGIAPTTAFELGIIYLANKLSIPRILNWVQSRKETVSQLQTVK